MNPVSPWPQTERGHGRFRAEGSKGDKALGRGPWVGALDPWVGARSLVLSKQVAETRREICGQRDAKRVNPRWTPAVMWPTGAGTRPPCPRESALRRAAISGNVQALPPNHVPTGRSVRVFICANPDETEAERNALKEHVYPKLRDFCRENYGIEFQVVDLYWGVDPEEWDNPDLQRLRMKLLEECLKTSAGPCFVPAPCE
ncbi:unnamed protein product [Gadus morhua 'NCC']